MMLTTDISIGSHRPTYLLLLSYITVKSIVGNWKLKFPMIIQTKDCSEEFSLSSAFTLFISQSSPEKQN